MMIKKRILPAICIVAVTVSCLFISPITRLLFFTAAAMASAWEMRSILENTGVEISEHFFAVYIACHAALCWHGTDVIWLIVLYCIVAFAIMLYGIICDQFGDKSMVMLFALVCPFLLYAVIIKLSACETWPPVFLSSRACDSAALCWRGTDVIWLIVLYCIVVFVIMLYGIICDQFGDKSMAMLFVLVYPFLLYAVIIKLSTCETWLPVFSIAILSSWVCDSAALSGGMAWGRHKLAPSISPNKTVEGSVIGAASSLLVGILLYYLLRQYYPLTLFKSITTAFVCSSFCQVGDLAASNVKRRAGVKDFSNLIPEHGGIMDKFDSLLFSIPTAWLCLRLAGVI
jgi:phosphatidate cytidylyltransferase